MSGHIIKILYIIVVFFVAYLLKGYLVESGYFNKWSTPNKKLDLDAFDFFSSQDSINSVVKELHVRTGAPYIVTSGQDSIKIGFDCRNYDYEIPYLNSFLSRGDSLYKEGGTDTLYVFKEGKEHYFLLRNHVSE